MSWNDGATKELGNFFDNLSRVGDVAVGAVKAQIDDEADRVHAELERTVPRGETGGLAKSLTKNEITDRRDWYGHRIIFDGEDKHGVPYQRIANILNSGTRHKSGKRFITKAIRRLRNMSDRINDRIDDEINKKL